MHFVRVGIQFEGKAGPIKVLQPLALLRQNDEARCEVRLHRYRCHSQVFRVAIVQDGPKPTPGLLARFLCSHLGLSEKRVDAVAVM